MMAIECQHGQLARACNICELESEVILLETKLSAETARADAAERELAELKRVIAGAQPASVGWHPIDTAPQNKFFDVWASGHWIQHCMKNENGLVEQLDITDPSGKAWITLDPQPTHWMPEYHPTAPKQEKKGGE